jgi:hypothetical protein
MLQLYDAGFAKRYKKQKEFELKWEFQKGSAPIAIGSEPFFFCCVAFPFSASLPFFEPPDYSEQIERVVAVYFRMPDSVFSENNLQQVSFPKNIPLGNVAPKAIPAFGHTSVAGPTDVPARIHAEHQSPRTAPAELDDSRRRPDFPNPASDIVVRQKPVIRPTDQRLRRNRRDPPHLTAHIRLAQSRFD